MSLSGRLFAACYDRAMSATEQAGLRERRRRLLAEAGGRVLEIGAGTGANVALYPDAVNELVLTEPEAAMARRLERTTQQLRRPLQVVRAPAERLPFADHSFDYAVSTLVLCTVADPAATLAELRRVLRPGGRLLFLEHVRSERPELARWQDLARPVWVRLAAGCTCNRDTLSAIAGAGFVPGDVEHGSLPKAPPFVRPLVAGSASR
jgi:ubiquinone/menaquinone biosynthesis C-methylase UbiE